MLTYKKNSLLPKTTHLITRRIPGQGKTLVRKGQKVKAYEIVGVGEKSLGFRSLNAAKLLGVKPEVLPRYFRKSEGSLIYKGEILARKKELLGLREIEILSPLDGILNRLDTKSGLVNLGYLPKRVKVPAGVEGVITQVGQRWVRVRTLVSEVLGICGVGKLKEGVIKLLGEFELPLRASQIDARSQGKILVGGSLVDKEVLYKSLAVGVKGLVVGGINFRDYRDLIGSRGPFEEVGLGVLVLEGFGTLPMAQVSREFFKTVDGQSALLYGSLCRLIIPSFEEQLPAKGGNSLKTNQGLKLTNFGKLWLGQKVKVLTLPYLNLTGIIKKLNSEISELPSGVRTKTLLVELEDGREIEVGGWNVEIIE